MHKTQRTKIRKSLAAAIAVAVPIWIFFPDGTSSEIDSLSGSSEFLTDEKHVSDNIAFGDIETNQIELPVTSTLENTQSDQTQTDICVEDCPQIVKTVEYPYALSDLEFENVLSSVDELADVLRENSELRSEWIELARHSTGNKRQVIIETFALLDAEDRLALGKALSESPSERHRLDGVQLLGRPNTMSKPLVPMFSDLLQTEQDQYVRGSAINALNQPDLFYGDQEVLEILEQVIYTDNNDAVRGEALLASTQLTENPVDLFYLSLDAVRSETHEYQKFGVRALEEILSRHTKNGDELSWQSSADMSQLVAEIMNPEFDDMPAEVRTTIDNLYHRFY